MKNMTKRVLSLLLCIVLCVTMLPGLARAAEETVPQAAARVRGTRLTDVPVSCGTYQYQPRAAGLTPMEGKLADANLNKAWRSGGQLDEAAQGLYGAVLDLAAQNAAGTLASTTYVFTDDDSWVYDCLYWSADMLGVDRILDDSGNITEKAKNAASARFGDCVDDAFDALLADNPYEFYWQDKTRKSTFSFSCSYYQSEEDGSDWLGITDITMPVAVSQDYAAKNADGTYQTSELDTVKCAATHQAIVKADAIVAAHAGESDFEKLQSYRKEICALTDYNDAAANAANNTPYGDPWQLIWVFDNDPDTKVVCEGYSKAFQLLCDRTEFDQSIDCITVSGTMSGGTGSGGHMWNVVTMEDGKHYIVDVTNCDTGTVGYPDLLFLTGAAEGGSVRAGYEFDCDGTPITYTYDATTRFLFAEAELTLSTDAYTPAAAEGIAVDETNFPDDAFRSYVSTHCDTDTNGWLSETEIDNVTLIAVNNDTEISSLKGVEFFTALRQLHCANTSLTELDVRRNTALERLNCDGNQLTELDVSQNTALTDLSCSINQLKALNVSNNTALKVLYVTGNQLTELDVSHNEALTSLECSSNPLTTLDVSHNPNLKLLHCGGTGLTELDVSHNSQLEQLWMQVTGISSIDLSANTALKILFCQSTDLTTLDISACPKLVDVVTNGERLENDGVLTYRILENNIAQAALMVDSTLKLITESVPTAQAYGCSLSLDGDIGINFYLVLPDEIFDDPDAYVTLNDKKLLIAGAPSVVQNGITMYEFKYRVAAKEMGKDVVLHAYSGADELLPLLRYSTGKDLTETGYHYTVQRYIQLAINSGGNANLIELMKAMSDYGSKAQVHFNYEVDNAAAIYYPEAIANVTADDLLPYKRVVTKTERTGIKYSSVNLTLESETTARLFFKLNEGTIDDYSFTIDGKAVTPISTTSGYAIEIRNVSAKDLDRMYTVEVRDSQGVCLTVQYCALSYAYLVVNNAAAQPADLVELVKALYLYNQAVNAYFA